MTVKVPVKPIVVKGKHTDECTCKTCTRQFASEYEPRIEFFAHKSILSAERAARLPEPRSERERAANRILDRKTTILEQTSDRKPDARTIRAQRQQLLATIEQLDRDNKLAELVGQEKRYVRT